MRYSSLALVVVAVMSGPPCAVMAGECTPWTVVEPEFFAGSVTRVAYGGGRFVALGDNRVITSTDGIEWDEVPAGTVDPPSPNLIGGVVWNGNVFLAVSPWSDAHLIVIGEDLPGASQSGLTWMPDAGLEGLGVFPQSVAWNGSSHVIVGGGAWAVSDDGYHWTAVESPESSPRVYYRSVCWDGRQWVAVGDRVVATSTDGVAWTARTILSADRLLDVANDGSTTIAVGRASLMSRDGQTWQPIPAPDLYGVTWSDHGWIGVGTDGRITTSADGTEWSLVYRALSSHRDVAVGDTTAVAVGGSAITVGIDGGWWMTIATPLPRPSDMLWNGSRFVAVAYSRAYESADGLTWRRLDDGSLMLWAEALVWYRSQYVAVGSYGMHSTWEHISTSRDGVSWSWAETFAPKDKSFTPVRGIAVGAAGLVAVGNGVHLVTEDGSAWQYVDLDEHCGDLQDVVWAGDRYVAVGRETACVSDDGRSWEGPFIAWDEPTPWNPSVMDWGESCLEPRLAGNGSVVVAVGAGGRITTTSNGIDWMETVTEAEIGFSDVHWTGTEYVAVTNHGQIFTSREGFGWTPAGLGVELPSECPVEDCCPLYAVTSSPRRTVVRGPGVSIVRDCGEPRRPSARLRP